MEFNPLEATAFLEHDALLPRVRGATRFQPTRPGVMVRTALARAKT
jgi:hypothetical protein